ncbi:Protein white [Nymphon striatum]|nr:Protein white [Nymphon striatum]
MLITCVKSNDTTNTVEDLKFTEILQNDLNCYIAPSGLLAPKLDSQERDYGVTSARLVGYVNVRHQRIENTIELTWENINVCVQPKGIFSKPRNPNIRILENGKIIFSNGAGKTTLLNVLTQRNIGNLEVSGSVCANGQPIGKSLIGLSAFVQQDNLMFPTLTVREHLKFQARLRMGQQYKYDEKMERVEEVIRMFGLEKCADTVIGQTSLAKVSKGISGGQKKRLAIASEYLTDPLLMFLDEPTSGLDSFMAETVIKTLKTLVGTGKTVICTIHQPSSETFELVDKHDLKCPVHYNPADFFVHAMAIKPGDEVNCKHRIKEKEAFAGMSMYKSGWITQFFTLYERALLSLRKSSFLTIWAICQTIIVAITVGLLYFRSSCDIQGVQNTNGVLFLTLMQCSFPYLFPIINTFTPELGVFRREHWNGMYRTDTYFLSKTFAEMPLYLILPMIYGSIVYWMSGMNPDPIRFGIYLGVCVLTANTSLSAGYMISCANSSVEIASTVTGPFIMAMVLFGGIFLNAGSVPVYFIWLKYLSWFNYAYEIMIVNQWGNIGNITGDYINLIPKLYLFVEDIE